MLKIGREKKWSGVLVLVVAILPSVAVAAVVDVTVSSDKSTIDIGETAVVTVSARVRPGTHAASNDGIFFWGADVSLGDVAINDGGSDTGDPDILSLPGTAQISSALWDLAGSSGTARSWGLEAVYDTQFNNQTRGFGSDVILFTLAVEGERLGIGSVTVAGNPIQGADFATHQGSGDDSGFFGGAAVNIEVTPEPTGIAFLALGGLAVLRRRRR